MLRITLTSVFVDDQEKAAAFYTDVLGFVRKHDVPLGADRWLTVVSAADPGGVELLLEPNGNPIAATYQRALHEAGIPATSFAVADIDAEYERLDRAGVVFPVPPTPPGPVRSAVFDDTCGNLIGLHQVS